MATATAAKAERKKKEGSRLRWWLRLVAIVIAVLVLLPVVLLPLYRFVNPPVTTVMLLKALSGAGINKTWMPLEEISPRLVRTVVTSEDNRFCMHHGIDWIEVQNALEDDDGRFRGASTITMQMVKNLFLWTGRSWVRKGLEAPLALYADLVLPKRRVMEIYLNVVEWGVGVYGAEAASQRYFNIPASKLSVVQAARLAAILPAPTRRDAGKPNASTRRIAARIAAREPMGAVAAFCILGVS